jgi:hypothetical protein
MAYKTVGIGTSIGITIGTATVTPDFAVQSNSVRVHAYNADGFVTVGSTPTADNQDLFIAKDTSLTLGMTKASQRVVGITTNATETIVSFPEGQQCPFGVGDYISVTGTGDAGITSFTRHKRVISVDTTAGTGGITEGYFMTRCTIAADTRKCYADGANWSDARAIASNKVSIKGANSGNGALYVQQVQITGDA